MHMEINSCQLKGQESNNLRKWQLRIYSQSSEDRNLSHALRVLDRFASQIGFQPAVKEHSALIYRQ